MQYNYFKKYTNVTESEGTFMSKTYEMLAESLNELITEYETNGGVNLTKEKIELAAEENTSFSKMKPSKPESNSN